MINVANALSVVFVFRLSFKDWEGKVSDRLASLRDLFEEIGDVTPRRMGPPRPKSDAAGRRSGEVFLQPKKKVELQNLAVDLEARSFQTFSATADVGEEVVLKFMLCPRNEVNWSDARPFDVMQTAWKEACMMAVWQIIGYDNQYVKDGRPEKSNERALSVNARFPCWHSNGHSSPRLIVDAKTGAIVVE